MPVRPQNPGPTEQPVARMVGDFPAGMQLQPAPSQIGDKKAATAVDELGNRLNVLLGQ